MTTEPLHCLQRKVCIAALVYCYGSLTMVKPTQDSRSRRCCMFLDTGRFCHCMPPCVDLFLLLRGRGGVGGGHLKHASHGSLTQGLPTFFRCGGGGWLAVGVLVAVLTVLFSGRNSNSYSETDTIMPSARPFDLETDHLLHPCQLSAGPSHCKTTQAMNRLAGSADHGLRNRC